MGELAIDGTNATPVQPVATAANPAPTTFLEQFKGHLVVLKDGHLQPADPGALNGVKYVMILFAAGWAKPACELLQSVLPTYYRLKRSHPEYELILVDEREEASAMEHFMIAYHMPWPAVRSDDATSGAIDLTKYAANGSVPCLVLVDDSGKILSNSWVNGNYVGGHVVLLETEKILPVSSEAP